ncbi:MAG: IreB family regulatory phosphoprotein [Halobacillus sp.]|uniref:IreB family regulatory phosphoprotein n=1 Tax=Halobacillus sp. TaxID=56800 RepID=UPI003BB1812C
MSSMDKTMRFNFSEEPFDQDVRSVLLSVHSALQEKGYNPINQIVGYLLSGDPAYIPRHQDARNLIRKIERDELIEELVKFYIRENNEGNE